jgi:hypothetical protein
MASFTALSAVSAALYDALWMALLGIIGLGCCWLVGYGASTVYVKTSAALRQRRRYRTEARDGIEQIETFLADRCRHHRDQGRA